MFSEILSLEQRKNIIERLIVHGGDEARFLGQDRYDVYGVPNQYYNNFKELTPGLESGPAPEFSVSGTIDNCKVIVDQCSDREYIWIVNAHGEVQLSYCANNGTASRLFGCSSSILFSAMESDENMESPARIPATLGRIYRILTDESIESGLVNLADGEKLLDQCLKQEFDYICLEER